MCISLCVGLCMHAFVIYNCGVGEPAAELWGTGLEEEWGRGVSKPWKSHPEIGKNMTSMLHGFCLSLHR